MKSAIIAAPATPARPYPGLRSFRQNESSIFFGREVLCLRMISILAHHHFLAVVGASGCGKSSLVRAGLLPELSAPDIRIGSPGLPWSIVTARPGGGPFRNLAIELASQGAVGGSTVYAQAIEAKLRTGSNGLIDAIYSVTGLHDRNILVVIDQFEEIFRFGDISQRSISELEGSKLHDEALDFVDTLLTAAQELNPQIYVAITMRSDSLGRCDLFSGLPEAITRCQFLPPRMSKEQLLEAIRNPLKLFNGTIDDSLVSDLLEAMGERQDQLPVIQHALAQLWQFAAGPSAAQEHSTIVHLTSQHAQLCLHEKQSPNEHERLAWVTDAISTHANTVYASLIEGVSEAQGQVRQQIARQLFCALCETDHTREPERRLSSIEEVAAIAFDTVTDENRAQVESVVEAFAREGNNFIVRSETEDGRVVLDISHESLMRKWMMLKKWNEEESVRVAGYLRLVDAVQQQEQILEGRRLRRALEWRSSFHPTATWAMRYDKTHNAALSQLAKCQQLINSSLAERRRKGVRRGMLLLLAIATVIIGVWQVKASLDSQYIKRLVSQFNSEDAQYVESKKEELAKFRLESVTQLKAQLRENTNESWLAHLALLALKDEPASHIEPLYDQLLNPDRSWKDYRIISDYLANYLKDQESDLRRIFGNRSKSANAESAESASAFRAGIALARSGASFSPEERVFLTISLVQARPGDSKEVRELLRPVRDQLKPTLRFLIVDRPLKLKGLTLPEELPGYWREMATESIVDYFGDDPDLLCDCACGTLSTRFRKLLQFESQSRSANEALQGALAAIVKDPASSQFESLSPEEIVSDPEAVEDRLARLGKKQALAVIALMRLNTPSSFSTTKVIQDALAFTPNPEIQTQFIHSIRDYDIRSVEIWNAYEALFGEHNSQTLNRSIPSQAELEGMRFTLLLCLGMYGKSNRFLDARSGTDQLHVDRMLDHVKSLYREHPSAAVHGAARWLLTQWDKEDPSQEAKMDEISKLENMLAELDNEILKVQGNSPQNRNWFVRKDRRGFIRTFVRFEPGEFQFGAAEKVTKRWQAEWNIDPKTTTIVHPFAVCCQEVTRREWDAYANYLNESKDPGDAVFRLTGVAREEDPRYYPHDYNPIGHVRWFDAVRFCHWLSDDGEDCYTELADTNRELEKKTVNAVEVDRIKTVKNWDLKPEYPNVGGYRLPKEIEWEYACRAGTTTTFSFGSAYPLTLHYAWYLDNRERDLISKWGCQKLPNRHGLFDMHGNMYEWCDDIGFFPGKMNGDKDRRVARGGGWEEPSHKCSSSWRYKYFPYNRHSGLGFRLVCRPPQ